MPTTPVTRPRIAGLGVIACLASFASACGPKTDPTSLVVRVYSDLTVGSEIDAVTVNGVTRAVASRGDLPVVLGFTPSKPVDEPVVVTAVARFREVAVVSQSFTTSFISGKAALLDIHLDRACVPVPCGTGRTCEAGACVAAQRPPSPYGEAADAADAARDGVALDAADAAGDGAAPDAAADGSDARNDGPFDPVLRDGTPDLVRPMDGPSTDGGDAGLPGVDAQDAALDAHTEAGADRTGSDVAAAPVCGNGVTETPETCDPGVADTPSCNGPAAPTGIECHASACGDGYRNTTAGEECDEGASDTPGCNGAPAPAGIECRRPLCGDAYRNSAAGEQCDEGPSDTPFCNGASAPPGLVCRPARCGDGYVNAAAGETCDPGPFSAPGCGQCQITPGFACIGAPSTCLAICGDGLVVEPETCDDRNTDACGTCTADCSVIRPPAAATGTIIATPGFTYSTGETFTLSDGYHAPVTFEFSDELPQPGHVAIPYAGRTETDVAFEIAAAIARMRPALSITATASGAMVLLTNDRPGAPGNVPITTWPAPLNVTGMSGGVAYDCPAGTGCSGNADCASASCVDGVCQATP